MEEVALEPLEHTAEAVDSNILDYGDESEADTEGDMDA